MMPRPRLPYALSVLLATALAACAPSTRPSVERDSVLVISLDGFRADHLDLGITPTLSRLANEGVRAAWMTRPIPR